MSSIDLNADLGESFGAYTLGRDSAVLALVSSANVACGFHAGDPLVMQQTVTQAQAHGVRIGAHPGYRDLFGFGRRAIAYTPEELHAEVQYQIGALQAIARAAGTRVEYVKPHGAMYNTIASDTELALAVIDAIGAVDPELKLMALALSPIVELAQQKGLGVIQETFADRAYTPEGTLVSRRLPGAVHHDPEVVAAQALAFATGQPIQASDGSSLDIPADSICVHGDNDEALAMIQAIVDSFHAAGIEVAS